MYTDGSKDKNKAVFSVRCTICDIRMVPRSTVKACNNEAGHNFYGILYLWRHILDVTKMNQ